MDLSSLPEDQRQQLQQLQQQFQEHQQQQQQQQQQQEEQQQQQQQIQDYSSSQAYDPTQVQSYDQSYYAYYQQQQYQQDPNQSHHPQYPPQSSQQQQYPNPHYDYYQADYANAYPQQQPPQQQQPHEQQQIQQPSAPIPASSEPHSQMAESGGGAAASGYGVPLGLNPAAAAAVAALAQLTQFAGTMEAAEKAMAMVGMQARGGGGYGPMMGPGGPFMGPGPLMHHHGQGPFHMPPAGGHRGGGRRGGGQFRGNYQGNFGNRPPRGGPPSRGRGRGRGRGGSRRFPPNGASSSSSSHPKPEPELNEEEAEPTADNHEESEPSKAGNTAPNKRPPQAAWCELCRVDCTSLEILEQHKNGKKHKKNLQRVEELQNVVKPVSEMQQEQKSVGESNTEVTLNPEIAQEGEDNKQTLPENLTTESVNNETKVEMDKRNDNSEQRRGMKRKMRGGRGGKRMRTSDGLRRPMEPPRPKVVIPLICDLCNVKCDTQEVFDRHLAGKKHISKVKRYEGHQAMYGPVGLQALYPPNPITQTLFPPPQAQGPQQAFYGPQGSYPPPYMPPHAHHSAQNPHHEVSGPSSNFDGQHSASFVADTNQNGVSGTEGTGVSQQVIQ